MIDSIFVLLYVLATPADFRSIFTNSDDSTAHSPSSLVAMLHRDMMLNSRCTDPFG